MATAQIPLLHTPAKCRDVLDLNLLGPEEGSESRSVQASSSGQAVSVLQPPGPRKHSPGWEHSNTQLRQTISPGCTCAATCPVPTPVAKGHKITGQRASRSPALALGPPVRVTGDAPAPKANVGGTMAAKEGPWHLREHRSE